MDDELARSDVDMTEAAAVKVARATVDLALQRLRPRLAIVVANGVLVTTATTNTPPVRERAQDECGAQYLSSLHHIRYAGDRPPAITARTVRSRWALQQPN